MKLETRVSVLDKALKIEKVINDILVLLLNVELGKKKAFNNKSGSLSFKNKIDLLFDIEIFNEKEHMAALLLMEYRNQFMHNFECDTFIDAFSFLGTDKKNRLLSYSKDIKDDTNEDAISSAFEALFREIIATLLGKVEFVKNTVTENKEYFDNLNNKISFLYGRYLNLFISVTSAISPLESDSKELWAFKIALLEKIENIVKEDASTDEFKSKDGGKSEEQKNQIVERIFRAR